MRKHRRHLLFQVLVFAVHLICIEVALAADGRFAGHFQHTDSLMVVDASGQAVVSKNASVPRVPASVTKLVLTWLALDKWGPDHRFTTEFHILDNALWVRGSGDPLLISEELDLLVAQLGPLLPDSVKSIHLDSSLFNDPKVPGRGQTNDPYNAPLTALAVNFNTVFLRREQGHVRSAEPQTPLTPTAQRLAQQHLGNSTRAQRVNLGNGANAQRQFAEILVRKLAAYLPDQAAEPLKIYADGNLPEAAQLLYRHKNSQTLQDALRGTLEYSNNFIANQLFLLLPLSLPQDSRPQVNKSVDSKPGEASTEPTTSFASAQLYAARTLQRLAGWRTTQMVDGAGLSRDNQFSAVQIDQVLAALTEWQHLFKRYALDSQNHQSVYAYAKSGTLTGVHTLAGFLHVGERQYRFVFMFNRAVPYGHREHLLQELAEQLQRSQ